MRLKFAMDMLDAVEVYEDVYYPDSDGEPVTESDPRRKLSMYAIETLSRHFAGKLDAYVSGNLLIYYRKGDNRAFIVPDVFVVLGVEKRDRATYKVWEEGKVPDLVIEFAPRTVRTRDEAKRLLIYREIGVREYFQFDPMGDYLHPPLQGRRRNAAGKYENIPLSPSRGSTVSLASQVLGLELHGVGTELRFFDAEKRKYLGDDAEDAFAHQREEEIEQRACKDWSRHCSS